MVLRWGGAAEYRSPMSDTQFEVSGRRFEVTVPGGILAGIRAGRGEPLLVVHGGPGLSDYSAMFADELTGWETLRYTQRDGACLAGRPAVWRSLLLGHVLFRDSQVSFVEGAGHFPWFEWPGCVAAALRRVATRLAAP